MKTNLTSSAPSTGLTPLDHFARISKLLLPLLVAGAASLGNAAIIAPQLGGSIDPAGGGEVDTEATGSVTLADFNSGTGSGKVIQANWSGISGGTGNTIDGGDVDVRIAHSPNFAASTDTSGTYNTSSVGTGYRWTGEDGQQINILFGTQSGSFSNNRTVRAAGLVLMNFGGAYTDVTITYKDPDDNVLSTQNFAGAADSEGSGGADFFTGYISSSQNIAKVTIDLTRNTGTSVIALDAVTYVVGPELESTIPADNATDVALDTDLTATFTKDIVANTGSIELRLGSDDSVVESLDVTTDVSIVDNQVTINPTSDLTPNSEYYVFIPDGAFQDADGVDSGGVSDPATWSFSTAIPDSATIDFDPTGEFAAEFSAGGYSEDATGGLDSSVGVAIAGGSPGGVTSLDGPQRSWAPSGTFSSGATMTVGAFFNASSFASGEVLRLGLTNGGTDNFASLPYGSILWDGTAAQLDIRSGVATGATFSLSTGQWYYFEVSFTRGASNAILYELAVANADSSGNVGSTIESFSQQTGTNLDSTELNKDIYAAFRGMQAAAVLDNFHASNTGASQLPVTFAGWIDTYFPGETDPAIIGLDADPDRDGNDNGVENFFGTAPDGFSQGLVSGTASGGTFTFTHSQGTLASDLLADYRWSKDLQTFYDNLEEGDGTTVEFTVQPDTPVAGATTVTATVTGTPVDKLFVRVEVDGVVTTQG